MSVYVHRFIEINRKKIDGDVDLKNLPKTLKVGSYYTAWKDAKRLFLKCEGYNGDKTPVLVEVDESSVPVGWELVKWYSDARYGYDNKTCGRLVSNDSKEINLKEHTYFCDNGGIIRDEYVSSRCESKFSERGYPSDMSDELREILKDDSYTWSHTSVLLSEWQIERDRLVEEFKNKLIKSINNEKLNDISEKIDILMKMAKDPFIEIPQKEKKQREDDEYDEYGEYNPTVEYLFEEDFWDILNVQHEINAAWHVVDEIYGWTSPEKIRIVYYCS
jgi:hypothetical protein